jgi:serine/threonine protein phosphatase PrpC
MIEITKFDLTPDDKFIVLASDGVWEFLENE